MPWSEYGLGEACKSEPTQHETTARAAVVAPMPWHFAEITFASWDADELDRGSWLSPPPRATIIVETPHCRLDVNGNVLVDAKLVAACSLTYQPPEVGSRGKRLAAAPLSVTLSLPVGNAPHPNLAQVRWRHAAAGSPPNQAASLEILSISATYLGVAHGTLLCAVLVDTKAQVTPSSPPGASLAGFASWWIDFHGYFLPGRAAQDGLMPPCATVAPVDAAVVSWFALARPPADRNSGGSTKSGGVAVKTMRGRMLPNRLFRLPLPGPARASFAFQCYDIQGSVAAGGTRTTKSRTAGEGAASEAPTVTVTVWQDDHAGGGQLRTSSSESGWVEVDVAADPTRDRHRVALDGTATTDNNSISQTDHELAGFWKCPDVQRHFAFDGLVTQVDFCRCAAPGTSSSVLLLALGFAAGKVAVFSGGYECGPDKALRSVAWRELDCVPTCGPVSALKWIGMSAFRGDADVLSSLGRLLSASSNSSAHANLCVASAGGGVEFFVDVYEHGGLAHVVPFVSAPPSEIFTIAETLQQTGVATLNDELFLTGLDAYQMLFEALTTPQALAVHDSTPTTSPTISALNAGESLFSTATLLGGDTAEQPAAVASSPRRKRFFPFHGEEATGEGAGAGGVGDTASSLTNASFNSSLAAPVGQPASGGSGAGSVASWTTKCRLRNELATGNVSRYEGGVGAWKALLDGGTVPTIARSGGPLRFCFADIDDDGVDEILVSTLGRSIVVFKLIVHGASVVWAEQRQLVHLCAVPLTSLALVSRCDSRHVFLGAGPRAPSVLLTCNPPVRRERPLAEGVPPPSAALLNQRLESLSKVLAAC